MLQRIASVFSLTNLWAMKSTAPTAALPPDYLERVYAGVLGKIIGVYLGRPIEGWTFERITAEFGEINYYIHERRGVPLVVTDDDISGTFTFVRALSDNPEKGAAISPADIGDTWLNYIIENKSILWWGGMGNSTEHTAYLRLKRGMRAPHTGSIATNGRVVAEQIGAQIFIDGWAMASPGNANLAADLATKAASVSHDGEAIYGAVVIAVMEAMAFVEPDLNALLDAAVGHIPTDSTIARMIGELRSLRRRESDWRKAMTFMQANYGYDKFGGNCHMIPNHGLIILALLWGDDDFQKSLMIVNTCGWDTDCNSANVGCILGIKNGLRAINAKADFRTPVADRLLLPTADAGGCFTDAATEAIKLANMGRRLAGIKPVLPKQGARFHFSLPGSVQGWLAGEGVDAAPTRVHQITDDGGALEIAYTNIAPNRPARAAVATFISPANADMKGYGLLASPTLYSTQTVRFAASTASGTGTFRPFIRHFNDQNQLSVIPGPAMDLVASEKIFEWQIPDTGGQPIAEVGLEILSAGGPAEGAMRLNWLTWNGVPAIHLRAPAAGTMYKRAWCATCSEATFARDGAYVLVIQNEGRGLLIHGTRDWSDYGVSAEVRPHMADACGIAVRVQGIRRYYALLLTRTGRAKLVRMLNTEATLAEAPLTMEFGRTYTMSLEVIGQRLVGQIDGEVLFDLVDPEPALDGGAVALVVEEGRSRYDGVKISPAS